MMRPLPLKQRGSALIIALIMLIMLTLLAVTASRFTMLGTRASFSFQVKNTAFEAAEVGITRGLSSIETGAAEIALDAQMVSRPSTSEQISITTGDFDSDVDFTITRVSNVFDTATSLGMGEQSSSSISRFVIRSTADVRDQNARSILEQGYTALRLSY